MVATLSVMLNGSRRALATSICCTSEVANPPAAALIEYLPGAKPVKLYPPSAPDVAVFLTPLASVSVTVAPTITAPNSSVIEPRTLARPWAKTDDAAKANSSNNDETKVKSFLGVMILLCREII